MLQQYLPSCTKYVLGYEHTFCNYNNYSIFKYAFYDLINNKDIYQLHQPETWDYYKYSPTFALFFGVFAILPDWLGLFLWHLFNSMCILIPVVLFAKKYSNNKNAASYILLFCLLDTLGQNSNMQSNAMLVGLLLLAFYFIENKMNFWSLFCVVATIFVKIYGVVFLLIYLLYPRKLFNLSILLILLALFAVLPLFVVSAKQLMFLYSSWWNLLMWDQDASYGLSLLGIVHSVFGVGSEIKLPIILVGVASLVLPLFKLNMYAQFRFRALYMCLIFCFIILFNHKSESPTFIVATLGVGVWFFMLSEQTKVDIFLIALYFIFATLSPTDIFPRFIRDNFIIPYCLKALPLVLIYPKILIEILSLKPKTNSISDKNK